MGQRSSKPRWPGKRLGGLPVRNSSSKVRAQESERANQQESLTGGEKENGAFEEQKEIIDEQVLRGQEKILCKIKRKKAGLKIAIPQQRVRNVVFVGRSRAGKFFVRGGGG